MVKLVFEIAIGWTGLAAILCVFVWAVVIGLARTFDKPAGKSISPQRDDGQHCAEQPVIERGRLRPSSVSQ
jgi:hypothetical protein